MAEQEVFFYLPGVAMIGIGVTVPILMTFLFRSRGRFETSGETLWVSFFLGMCSVFLVIATSFVSSPIVDSIETIGLHFAADAFINAAIPEEAIKFSIVWFFAMRHYTRETTHDLLVMSVAVAAGFSAIENVFFFISGGEWQEMAIGRSLLSTPSHIFSGAAMGGLLALSKIKQSRLLIIAALVVPIIMHGHYNFFIYTSNFLPDGAFTAGDKGAWLAFSGFLGINLVNIGISLRLSNILLKYDTNLQRRFELPPAKIIAWWRATIWVQKMFWGSLGVALIALSVLLPFKLIFEDYAFENEVIRWVLIILSGAHGTLFMIEAMDTQSNRFKKAF